MCHFHFRDARVGRPVLTTGVSFFVVFVGGGGGGTLADDATVAGFLLFVAFVVFVSTFFGSFFFSTGFGVSTGFSTGVSTAKKLMNF